MKSIFGPLLVALFLAPIASAFAAPAHIFILRHGEKNNDEERHLSEKGYKRAAALANFFHQKKFTDAYGTPAVLFAARGKPGKSIRSIETLQPTAQAFGMRLNTSFEKGEEKDLVKELLDDSSLDGKTVIIAWNHTGIPRFLKPLDLKADWEDGSYDRFWILSSKANGNWKFRDVPQRLLPGDSSR